MGCSPVRLRPDAVALRWVFRRTDVRLITSVLLCPICRDHGSRLFPGHNFCYHFDSAQELDPEKSDSRY